MDEVVYGVTSEWLQYIAIAVLLARLSTDCYSSCPSNKIQTHHVYMGLTHV